MRCASTLGRSVLAEVRQGNAVLRLLNTQTRRSQGIGDASVSHAPRAALRGNASSTAATNPDTVLDALMAYLSTPDRTDGLSHHWVG